MTRRTLRRRDRRVAVKPSAIFFRPEVGELLAERRAWRSSGARICECGGDRVDLPVAGSMTEKVTL